MIRTEDYKRELVSILFAQKHVVFWTTLIIFVGAICVAYFWTPIHSASGSILVRNKKPPKSPEALEGDQPRSFPLSKEDLASEVEVLSSTDVLQQTVKYLSAKYPRFSVEGADRATRAEAVYAISRNLKTRVIPASNVIGLEYFSADPDEAVDVLTVLMEQYILYRMKLHNPSQSGSFFASQADRFKRSLEEKEDSLLALVDQTGVSNPQKEIENNIILKKTLEQELSTLRNDYVEAEINLEHLQSALAEENLQYFSFLDSELINSLSLKMAELYAERGRFLRTYHHESDVIKTIDGQIWDTFSTLKQEVHSYMGNMSKQLKIVAGKVKNIELAIAEYDEKNVLLQKQILTTKRIVREAELLKFSYETFEKRREEADINTDLDSSGISTYVSILSKAFPSDGPVYPKRNVVIPLGLLVGIIVGLSVGFIREYFDHTFKRPSDVEAFANLPVLFSLSKPQNRTYSLIYGLFIILVLCAVAVFLISKSGLFGIPVR